VVYHLLKYQEEFVLLNAEVYSAKAKMQRMSRLQKDARSLGFQMVECEAVA
jgi:hypothetical protein